MHYFLGFGKPQTVKSLFLVQTLSGCGKGLSVPVPGCRLFVVSPKVALVLRQNKMGPEFVHDINVHITLTNKLIDVPMSRATLTYANYQDPPGAIILTTKRRQLEHCGNIGRPQKHRKTFSPTKLTQKQTRALNHVNLIHLLNSGLTFSSPSAVRKTIQYHLQSDIPYARESKYLFRNLLGLLSEKTLSTGPNSSMSLTPPSSSAVDVVLHRIASGAIEFRSNYDRAYWVYHLATDDITKYNQSSSEIHQMTAILAMKETLPPLPIVLRHMYFPFLCRDIVKELPKEESELFFHVGC